MSGTASARELDTDLPGARVGADRSWRRDLRRHAPVVPWRRPHAAQKVHNVYHHLEDRSLPYDLWDDEAELAAIVYALHLYSLDQVSTALPELVRSYIASNRRIGVRTRTFDAERLRDRIQSVAGFVRSLPIEDPAKAFCDLLRAGVARSP